MISIHNHFQTRKAIHIKPVTRTLFVAACGLATACAPAEPATSSAPAPSTPPAAAIQPAFAPLKFGDIRPQGWVLAQMKRDLDTGFAGHLDELCHEASSDIFASGRNGAKKSNSKNAENNKWWNGETEGNWRSGHLMLACLTRDPVAMIKAKTYVEHILASQDADGYLGIFEPNLRYRNNGELWTQTCLFRGLLAYAEAAGDDKVYAAVKHAVDRTIEGYAGKKLAFESGHDMMYTDILDYLNARTGDRKYVDFGVRLYRSMPNLMKFQHQGKLSGTYHNRHCARMMEAVRVPFWLWSATGDRHYLDCGETVVAALRPKWLPGCGLASGGPRKNRVPGDLECVADTPDPWTTFSEYCSIAETHFSMVAAGQKTGGAAYLDAAEEAWLNGGQGSREPDASALLYFTAANRLSVNDEGDKRQRFSPTQQQVAVCCSPNASRLSAFAVAHAWMKPTGAEPALAATLYAPCEVKTQIADTAVTITEKTRYPYGDEVVMAIQPVTPVTFCLWLRNPHWSENTQITCAGATITRVGDFWQLRKEWQGGDTVSIKYDQKIREVPALNGDVALQYGPLLYVLPAKGETKTVKTYKNSNLKDYHVTLPPEVKADNLKALALPKAKRATAFGFTPKAVAGTNPDYPLDNPLTILEGELIGKDGKPVPSTLVPIGAKAAQLRLVTFPVTK